jgi:hypothetical protein
MHGLPLFSNATTTNTIVINNIWFALSILLLLSCLNFLSSASFCFAYTDYAVAQKDVSRNVIAD